MNLMKIIKCISFVVFLLLGSGAVFGDNFPVSYNQSGSTAGGLMDEKILKGKAGAAYLISNIPEIEVMPKVYKSAMISNKDFCRFVPLSKVGKSNKKKEDKEGKDLLPYNWEKENKTIVVIDRSRLEKSDEEAYKQLMLEMFPFALDKVSSTPGVFIYVQGYKDSKKIFNFLIDVPEMKWLEPAVNDLWCVRESQLPFVSNNPIQSVAILTNDEMAGNTLLSAFNYGNKQVFGLDRINDFKNCQGITHKMVAINWNGDTECPADTAIEFLPADLQQHCDSSAVDRSGLTKWQQFCHQTAGDNFSDGNVQSWIFRSPTPSYLQTIAKMAVDTNFKEKNYSLNICDLSYIESIAVGTYLTNNELNQSRLVVQEDLENITKGMLKSKVKEMYSSQDWGALVQSVLGDATDSPFSGSGGAQKVVRKSDADALLVLWVNDLSPSTVYSYTENRLTPDMGKFDKYEPEKPDPNCKPLFSGYRYPGANREERERSGKYIRDYSSWIDDHAKWERDRDNFEYNLRNCTVSWEQNIIATPNVKLSGSLKLIDLRTQNLIWSCNVSSSSSGDVRNIQSFSLTTRGNDSRPDGPNVPQNTYSWDDTTYMVGQNSFKSALREGVGRLAGSVLWAQDMKPWCMPIIERKKLVEPEPDDKKAAPVKTAGTDKVANPVKPGGKTNPPAGKPVATKTIKPTVKKAPIKK